MTARPVGTPVPDWRTRPRPMRLVLPGHTCRLEPLDPARHADHLFEAYAAAPDGGDWTYLASERLDDRAAYRAFVDTQAASDDPLHYAIVVGDAPVGTASLMRIDPANGVIEVGHIAFAPALQRTPAGTEAIFLLMRYVFADLGYRRFEWKCDSLNAPSRRAALRYGFQFEGIFRQAIVTKGRNRDTAWYAMIDKDWPGAKAAFEAWLRPENFDASGRQIRALGSREAIPDAATSYGGA